MIGKIMVWHGKWCPAWKAQKEIERVRQEAAKKKRGRKEARNRK
jgi:hypothetical protein